MRRWAEGLGASCFLLLLFWRIGEAQPPPASLASDQDMSYFVRIENGQFVANCKSLFVSGWNQWEAVEASAGALELFGASLPPNTTGPALVRGLLDRAVANGFSVVRAWAHAVTAQYALQTSPGQYNEAVFRGLDYLLDEARKRGIRVLLSLTDNWQQTGGADEFVRWVGGGLTHDAFFTDPRVKALFKSHVEVVLGCTNTINGRRYSDDPTIFAWGLINEPRCYQCGTAVQLWVQEMAAYVKSLDSNHLLTIGEEGFYPAGIPQAAANPGGLDSWATKEGQNFVADHASPDIDFMAVHLWVNNWNDKSPQFVQRWIQQHAQDAQAAGKPLLLEEFGVWAGDGAERKQYYQQIYNLVQQDAQAGGPLQGALFWTWYAEGQRAPAEEGGGAAGLFGVFEGEDAWSYISSFAQAMRQLSGTAVPTCAAGGRAPVPPAPDCDGTGREGPGCTLDVNECARGTAGCNSNAACTNTDGGATCSCFPGYVGDGKTSCVPDVTALAAVQGRYTTDGSAMLACSEGQDVPYPEGAPGFQYDLTGALARTQGKGQQGGLGSRTDVQPLACMLACEEAPSCNSFAYNPSVKKCFLKSGATRQTCRAAPTTCVSARGKPYSCGVWQTYFRAGGPSAGSGTPATPDAAPPGAGGSKTPAAGPASPTSSSAQLPAAPQQRAATVQLVEAFTAP